MLASLHRPVKAADLVYGKKYGKPFRKYVREHRLGIAKYFAASYNRRHGYAAAQARTAAKPFTPRRM